MAEADLESGVLVTAGWFVVNMRDARWLHNRMRSVCRFGGEGAAHFDDLGVSLFWWQPGRPMSLYHQDGLPPSRCSLEARAVMTRPAARSPRYSRGHGVEPRRQQAAGRTACSPPRREIRRSASPCAASGCVRAAPTMVAICVSRATMVGPRLPTGHLPSPRTRPQAGHTG
jgi:hypothetical protein